VADSWVDLPSSLVGLDQKKETGYEQVLARLSARELDFPRSQNFLESQGR
jgi:hypothetical protein